MGITLLPWQKWLLVHALELNEDGTFRFRIIVLLVARQNGKSTLLQVLTLWRMYVDGAPLVIGTAQTLDIAEEQWLGAVEIAEGVPELQSEIANINRTNGKYSLELTGKQKYKVKAATRRGARGLSGDLVLLDEIREHQVWDAWASVTKTTMARALAQIWAASNAGDLSSVVLRHLRALGHRALGYPDGRQGIAEGLQKLEALANGELDDEEDDAVISAAEGMDEAAGSLGIFEWSAPPDASVWDRDGWAQANPSMGYTIREQDIASFAASDPEHVFRTECLCQFVTSAMTGPFPAESWERSLDPVDARRARGVRRDPSRPLVYCVDVSVSRMMAYIAVAFYDTEGRIRFEIAAQGPGSDWIAGWLLSPDRAVKADHVVVQGRGAPASALIPGLELAGVPVVKWEGSDIPGWYGVFFDLVAAGVDPDYPLVKITHGAQPPLDIAAVGSVTRDAGDGKFIDRRLSPRDAAPLCAAIGAVGYLSTNPAPRRSVYETRDLMVV